MKELKNQGKMEDALRSWIKHQDEHARQSSEITELRKKIEATEQFIRNNRHNVGEVLIENSITDRFFVHIDDKMLSIVAPMPGHPSSVEIDERDVMFAEEAEPNE